MPAKGSIDISIKFSGIPLADPDTKGFTQIEISTEEGYTVLAKVKTKTFKRFLESSRKYDYWEGMVMGKLLRIQGPQLFLSGAGVQCYEKKPPQD